MEDAPWREVFEWLADQTQAPVFLGGNRPRGAFSFAAPPGTRLTLPQAVTVIERALRWQGLRLIRRGNCFIVVKFEEGPIA
jgi:hypothetical protein